MRILHLTRDYPPRINGGISVAVAGWVRASYARGSEHAVVSFDGWRPRARIRRDSSASSRAPALAMSDAGREPHGAVLRVTSPEDALRAVAFADEHPCDVVHVHHGMLWDLAATIARTQRARTVFTVHVDPVEQARLRGAACVSESERAHTRALAVADVVTAPSRGVLSRLREHVEADRLRWVPLGVDLPTDLGAAARASEPTALYAGRFADVKGTAELFTAIGLVVARLPGVRFLIAGGLPDSAKRERRWRRRFERAASDAARARTRFCGWLAPQLLAELYREAWVLVAPSWTESFGLSALEAMAHGVPVVGGHNAAMSELVRDGVDGLLSPPQDAGTLAEHLAALLDDRPRAEQMGEAARRRAAELGWPRAARVLDGVYRELGG